MNVRRSGGITLDTLSADILPVEERGVLNEGAFHRMISLERKRTERSRKPFLLMLVDMGDGLRSDRNDKALDKMKRSPPKPEGRLRHGPGVAVFAGRDGIVAGGGQTSFGAREH